MSADRTQHRGATDDVGYLDAALGDLAQEHAERVEGEGAVRAGVWLVGECMRSAPHLARGWLAHAYRHRPWQLLLLVSLVATATIALLVIVSSLRGPPVRLEAAAQDASGVIINSMRPAQLPVRVLDGKGRALAPHAVQYRRIGGMPIDVSPLGVLTCARRGDVRVEARLGELSTAFDVRCRPVRDVGTIGMHGLSFVEGDAPRPLALLAVGPDDEPVTLLTGELRVRDSTVATLHGEMVHPRSSGETRLDARIGDVTTSVFVKVFAVVPTLERLRPEQDLVAAPVRLQSGEMKQWVIGAGYYHISMLPGDAGAPTPKLAIAQANCVSGVGEQSFMCVTGANGVVIAYVPPGLPDSAVFVGRVAVERAGGVRRR